jgi:hypothetical protein
MPVLEVKEESQDDQEIIDLAKKIKEANRAKLAQSASYQSSLPLSGSLAMARPGQPAIQQYFNGTGTATNGVQSNGTGANGKAAEVSDKPVDEESKESW